MSSKLDTSYVQGRTAAGGWSQQRFARRRVNQAKAAAEEAADIAVGCCCRRSARWRAWSPGGPAHCRGGAGRSPAGRGGGGAGGAVPGRSRAPAHRTGAGGRAGPGDPHPRRRRPTSSRGASEGVAGRLLSTVEAGLNHFWRSADEPWVNCDSSDAAAHLLLDRVVADRPAAWRRSSMSCWSRTVKIGLPVGVAWSRWRAWPIPRRSSRPAAPASPTARSGWSGSRCISCSSPGSVPSRSWMWCPYSWASTYGWANYPGAEPGGQLVLERRSM